MSENNRSHPKSLRKIVRDTLKECSLPEGSVILLGVSGGSDSMALMYALSTLQSECKFHLHCIGVNHNLREEAQSEIDKARQFAQKLFIPFYVASVFIKQKSNIQENARIERYRVINETKELLKKSLKTNVYVSSAHHMEDKAETILLRIIRGTSVKGLNVLEPLKGDLLRPMIKARKRDVMLYIKRKNIPYSDDPSNMNTKKYQRSKVRYELLPLLEKMNPNIVATLCELSDSAKYPEITGMRMNRKSLYGE